MVLANGTHADPQPDAEGGTKVSFRDDVEFADSNEKMDAAIVSSTRSTLSSGSGGGTPDTSTHSRYTKLRSSLTREQTKRDPFFFYQVTVNLGCGSMGDVKLVKKRANKVGGSARRDYQQAIKRQQQEEKCLNLPVIGNLFQTCIDNDDEDRDRNGLLVPESSQHSVFSFLSGGTADESTTVSAERSFEDSLLKSNDDGSSNESSSSQQSYAMKSILLDQVMQDEFIAELRNEIAILKDLDHPNIVRAMETFEWRGTISIVMELCSGGDLYARDPYTELEAARLVRSICSAIAYMHSKNVVHRDLKFENVLFANTSPLSDVKLIDFGLSKIYCRGVDQKLTDVSGTIYTMAPEVMRGEHTEKADMWSIGTFVCLYVCTYMYTSSIEFVCIS